MTLNQSVARHTNRVNAAVSQFLVAGMGAGTDDDNLGSTRAQFAFICIFIFFFASTFGPGAWVVTGEIFPLKARAKCLSLTTASNWIFNWLLSFITPYMVDDEYAGLYSNVFWIWGTFNWISLFFVYFMIYETKDMSLEHVDELYENVSKAWRSAGYRANPAAFLEARRTDLKGADVKTENVEGCC